MGIKAIAGLIPIYLHFWKLSGHDQLRTSTLLHNHVIKILLERRYVLASELHWLSLEYAEKIFDSSIHLYQLQTIAISKELWEFFNKHLNNSIEFWNCSSNENWHLYALVDNKTKKFNLTSIYLCKMSWNFSKKEESDNIIKK